jgi:uncharacterized protein YuzE
MPANSQPAKSERGLRAEYDADHRVLVILLPDDPDAPGCVKHTEEREGGLLYDIGHDDEIIGIEVLLSEPLSIHSGDNGVTRTSSLLKPMVFGPEYDGGSGPLGF